MAGPRVNRYEQKQAVGAIPGTARVSAPGELGQFLIDAGTLGQQAAAGEARREEVERREGERRQKEADRIWQEREDRRQLTAAHATVSQGMVDFDQYEADVRLQTKGDPEGYAQQVNKAWNDWREKALSGIKNERARDWFDQATTAAGAQRFRSALGWQAARASEYDMTQFGNTAENEAKGVYNDPTRYATSLTLLDMMAGTARFGQAAAEKGLDAARRALRFNATLGMVERDPTATLALLERRAGVGDRTGPPAGLTGEQQKAWAAPLSAAQQAELQSVPDAASRAAAEAGMRDANAGVTGFVRKGDDFARSEPGTTGVPWIDDLDTQQVETLLGKAREGRRRGMADQAATVRAALADATEAATRGESRPIPPVETFVAAYGPEAGQEEFRKAQQIPAFATTVSNLRGAPFAYLTELATAPLPGPGAPAGDYKAAADRRDFVARAVGEIVKGRQRSWIDAASAEGIATIAPIDWNDPQAAASELATRQRVAQMRPTYVPDGAGPGSVLTTQEAAAFGERWRAVPPGAQARMLRTMGDALTDRGVFGATLAQIAPDSVATQVAAGIAANSAGHALPTAERILAGERRLNPGRAARKEDGKPQAATPLPTDFAKAYAEAIGDALAGNPAAFDAGGQAVAAWYTAAMADAGKMGKDEADGDVLAQAIDAVIGARVDYGGIGKVVAPWGMDAGTARDRLVKAYHEAAQANGMTDGPMATLSRVRLINHPAREGAYFVWAGDRPVKGKDGEPIVLDINGPKFPRDIATTVPQ